MIIEDGNEKISLNEIEKLESRLGFKFPDGYKMFILCNNGGHPIPDEFTFDVTDNETSKSLVQFFYAIYDGYGIDNLEINYNYFVDSNRILPNILPIACDPFGNFVCISVCGEDKGAVYFWDHECEPRTPSYDNLFFVAKTYAEFLALLK